WLQFQTSLRSFEPVTIYAGPAGSRGKIKRNSLKKLRSHFNFSAYKNKKQIHRGDNETNNNTKTRHKLFKH
ncbi:hypothetical protein, partial [Kitasatospora cineracea]|uniref:hypothetical protein n=1 Tax=Kitasatospora cineracea TaxID=88074 RepID=UPI003797C456